MRVITADRELNAGRGCDAVQQREEVCTAITEQHPEENAMRWFRIRKANIDPTLREAYEQYGVVSLQLD